jgi:hypothetical protein
MKNCPICDGKIPIDASSCHYCGSELSNENRALGEKQSKEPIWLKILYKDAYQEVVSARDFKLGVVQIAPFVIIFGLGISALLFIFGESFYARVELITTTSALLLLLLLKGVGTWQDWGYGFLIISILIFTGWMLTRFELKQLGTPEKFFILWCIFIVALKFVNSIKDRLNL